MKNKILIIFVVGFIINCFGFMVKSKGDLKEDDKKMILQEDYFLGAKIIKFFETGKEIVDKKTIKNILKHLDLSEKRQLPSFSDGFFCEVTLKDGNKVNIKLTPNGWGFIEDIGNTMLVKEGNVRLIKDALVFEKKFYMLWEKYGIYPGEKLEENEERKDKGDASIK